MTSFCIHIIQSLTELLYAFQNLASQRGFVVHSYHFNVYNAVPQLWQNGQTVTTKETLKCTVFLKQLSALVTASDSSDVLLCDRKTSSQPSPVIAGFQFLNPARSSSGRISNSRIQYKSGPLKPTGSHHNLIPYALRSRRRRHRQEGNVQRGIPSPSDYELGQRHKLPQ